MSLNRKIAIVSILSELDELFKEEEIRRPRGPDRQWIRDRPTKGAFVNIFKDLELSDSEGFCRFTRMDMTHFQELLSIIGPDLRRQDTSMRTSISPKEQIALSLRFLVTGETFRSLEFQFRISRKAISYIVVDVVDAIYRNMGGKFLSPPSSQDEWLVQEKLFRERWNFPHCVGAIDGKHVRMQACGLGSQYHNYKGTHSIIMMIAAGGDYEVLWADVGTNGKVSDGAVLKNSNFGRKILDDDLNLPRPQPLPRRTLPVPYVFIGDEAFALSPNIMKPYPKPSLDTLTRLCNYRFSRARRISENVFGILCAKWRVLLSTMVLHPSKVRQTCLGVLTLHNWLRSTSSKYITLRLPDRNDPIAHEIIPGEWREQIAGLDQLLPLEPLKFANPAFEIFRIHFEIFEIF